MSQLPQHTGTALDACVPMSPAVTILLVPPPHVGQHSKHPLVLPLFLTKPDLNSTWSTFQLITDT